MAAGAIKKLADHELRKLNRSKVQADPPADIYECIARYSPSLDPPYHLDPYVQVLHRAIREGDVEAVVHAPPQHGKTIVGKHALIYAAIARPGLRHIYSTYNHFRALAIRNQVKRLAEEAGLDPHSRDAELELAGGTIIQFCGTGGSLTGFPCDGLHLCDDPIKDRAEANSKTKKDAKWDWWCDVAETRRHPGSSAVMMHTRWAQDDPAGRLIDNESWPYIRMPAVCDSPDDPLGRSMGDALWPQRRPADFFDKAQRNPITWASVYQGHPRPPGDSLFQGVHYYERRQLPTVGYSTAYGADLAYTAKTSADWSVLVCARVTPDGWVYITNVVRKQLGQSKFAGIIRPIVNGSPGPCLFFGATTERGAAQLMRETIPTFMFARAAADKFVRAQPTAEELWNPGKVLVPDPDEPGAPQWVHDFVLEVSTFTGLGDAHDDQVDALAALGTLVLRGVAYKHAQKVNKELRQRLRFKGRGNATSATR